MSNQEEAPQEKKQSGSIRLDPSAWAKRVHDVQFSRLSDRDRAELHERVQRAQTMSVQMKKCKAVEHRSHQAKTHSMQAMSASATWHARDQQAMAHQMMEQMERDDQTIVQSSAVFPSSRHHTNEAIAAVTAEPLAPPIPLAKVLSDEEERNTLAGLRKEPGTDEECSAKFAIYEAFSTKVSSIRRDLDELVGETALQLPELPRKAVEAEMKKLDCARNTGIQDESRNWFVYDMYAQSISNCTTMQAISERVTQKLKLVTDMIQTECPICLEKWTSTTTTPNDDVSVADVTPITLSCCHQVCSSCWENWCALNGGALSAFCPLCRHREFVDVLHRRNENVM